MDANPVCQVGAELGEGPVWVERDAALWFVDIKARRAHRWHPGKSAHRFWTAPQQLGFLEPLRDGGFVAGLKTGLHRFDPEAAEFVLVRRVEPQLPDNRLNDACVSPEGELWFGSMHDLEVEPSGALYRWGADGRPVCLDRGYVVTNGPAFSPDGTRFYHTSSTDRTVYVFDRPDAHTLARKRIFVQIEDGGGSPDGTAVDQEGCVWVALWDGWAVRRYSPEGKLLAIVRLPCANVTKIAFGGPDLCTAYVTTAWKGMTPQQRAAQPLAGDLFSFEAPAPGLRPVAVRPFQQTADCGERTTDGGDLS